VLKLLWCHAHPGILHFQSRRLAMQLSHDSRQDCPMKISHPASHDSIAMLKLCQSVFIASTIIRPAKENKKETQSLFLMTQLTVRRSAYLSFPVSCYYLRLNDTQWQLCPKVDDMEKKGITATRDDNVLGIPGLVNPV